MSGLKIRAFGALQVWDGRCWRRVTSGQERVLLACLLLRPNEIVPAAQLADVLWGDAPPVRPNKVLGTYISRLRARGGDTLRIEFYGGGYRLSVEPDQVDLMSFESRCRDGARAFDLGHPRTAIRLLDEALALWTGQPFADVPERDTFAFEVANICESAYLGFEILARAVLMEFVEGRDRDLDRIDAVISGLRRVLRRAPFQERLWCLLMQALVLSGRPVEAIRAYLEYRTRLVDELGLEPSVELRTVYQEIITESFRPERLGRPAGVSGHAG